MMKNLNYDLVNTLAQKLSARWRYEKYAKDAKEEGCESCSVLWDQMKSREDEMIDMLKKEIKKHCDEGMFD